MASLAENAITRLATVAGVDLNTATLQPLYVVPAGKTAIITHVVVRNACVSLTTANYGFGYDAGATNVIAQSTHPELTGPTLYTVLAAMLGALAGVAGASFGVKCSVLQGSAATVTISVFGYLF